MKINYLQLEIQPCPICSSDNFHLLKNNDRYFMGIKTVGCLNCGLIQTNPRPTQDSINYFYAHDYRYFYQGLKSANLKHIQKFNKNIRFQNVSKFLSEYIPFSSTSFSLLDIGCSEGEFFVALRSLGYKGHLCGVEINSNFAKFAAKRSDAKVVKQIEDFTSKFNFITMHHVFEHFLNPQYLINKIKSKLRKGGYVYIDVPDADEYSNLDDLHIAHLFHYTQRTLPVIFENAGFTIVLCEKYSPIGHPKSIRLLARFANIRTQRKYSSTTRSESLAWKKITTISILNKRVKVLLSLVPGLSRLYRLIKNQLKA